MYKFKWYSSIDHKFKYNHIKSSRLIFRCTLCADILFREKLQSLTCITIIQNGGQFVPGISSVLCFKSRVTCRLYYVCIQSSFFYSSYKRFKFVATFYPTDSTLHSTGYPRKKQYLFHCLHIMFRLSVQIGTNFQEIPISVPNTDNRYE